jgi:predicted nucleic acid-binding protein
MKYVVDSSVAIKCVLPEVDSSVAIRLLDEFQAGAHELIAPDIFVPEIADALATAERQGRIKTGQSAIFLNDILQNGPAYLSTTPLLMRAMELSISKRRAVYDCAYLALAEVEQCELVTADEQFARGLRMVFPSITSLAMLP